MKILVACESSGTVREAFRKLGHDAWSNDIQPADDGSKYHLRMDARAAMFNYGWSGLTHQKGCWDLIIMHPPCTALAVSGNAWYGKDMPKHQQRLDAIEWTMSLYDYATRCAPQVCMENPVGVLPIKATQYIQPWQHGHPESKKTGLWLHNLPTLEESDNVKDEYDKLPKNQQQRMHYLPPSKDRWKIRSKTYQGIADAMANQWSK